MNDKVALGDAFVTNIVNSHKATLIHLSIRNCEVSKESTTMMCRKCTELETLKMTVPAKEMVRPDVKKYSACIAQCL